jgi:recombination protein RecT
MAQTQTRGRQDDRQQQPRSGVPQRIEAYKAGILSQEHRNELARVIPRHVPQDLFERNLGYALAREPRLITMEPTLVFHEVAKLTALSLLLDPHFGEAYIIIAYDGRLKTEVPQGRVGYRGLMKLAKQSGEIGIIYASEVCEHDVFKETRGDDKRLVHEPDSFGQRGAIVGYYSHVTYRTGAKDHETMTLEDVHKIRNRSDGWKAFQADKIRSTPWGTDENEMAKKTVIRRLCKRLPQSPDLAAALKLEDAAEFSEMRDVTPRPRLIAPPSSQQRAALAHQPQESVDVDARPQQEREAVPAETSQPEHEEKATAKRQSAPQTGGKAQPVQDSPGGQDAAPEPAQDKPKGKAAEPEPEPFNSDAVTTATMKALHAAKDDEAKLDHVWETQALPHKEDFEAFDWTELENSYRDLKKAFSNG